MSAAQQLERFPRERNDCQTQAADKCNGRTPETFKATINDRSKDQQAQQNERDRKADSARGGLIPHSGIDDPHQPSPLEDAGS